MEDICDTMDVTLYAFEDNKGGSKIISHTKACIRRDIVHFLREKRFQMTYVVAVSNVCGEGSLEYYFNTMGQAKNYAERWNRTLDFRATIYIDEETTDYEG